MSDTGLPHRDRDALVAGYLRFAEALAEGVPDESPEIDAAGEAFETVNRLITHGPVNQAWEVVLDLLSRAPDDRLDVYAAGPLEDLVRRHGVELVDIIERETARNERFRWALGCIWLTVGELPPNTLERIVRASDGEIKPLDPGALRPHRGSAT